MSFALGDLTLGRLLPILLAVGALACADLIRRRKHQPSHLLFACALGTFLSVAIIRAVSMGFSGDEASPFVMAALIVCVVIAWRSLFGPWETQTKATVLGTFLFWMAVQMLRREDGDEQTVRLIAAGVALVPAIVWVTLFLRYHAERLSAVLMVFFAGMLATAPILFYDFLVRRGVELQFFLFRITPQSFSRSAQTFVSEHLPLERGIGMTVAATMLTFVFVALIEEVSKYWVLSRSARPIFRSIDDVLQLSVVAAIGFAFAENIVNPVYFTAFVREYLLHGSAPDMTAFVGNVLGRSVLTTMVHIFSTGVLGYFLALSMFASPYLRERHKRGHAYRLTRWIHALLRVPEASVFRVNMAILGLLCAVSLHGAFNFIVTLPELLPGHPDTLGELAGKAMPAFLGRIPFLLLPSLLYVVGGFWVLTTLFVQKENMMELEQAVEENDA